jgi:ATP-dependent helicase/nuclease subunit A
MFQGLRICGQVLIPGVIGPAIGAKILAEGLSEEMRVLYVAMTRARDRLIMTYASPTLAKDIADISMRLELCGSECLTQEADCPGTWVLMTALQRTEAGALFALGGRPEKVSFREPLWHIQVVQPVVENTAAVAEESDEKKLPAQMLYRIQNGLSYRYPHVAAVSIPSKQTATQLKGRDKDKETAENTHCKSYTGSWRKASFAKHILQGKDYGNAIHAVMQYIRYDACTSVEGVKQELARLQDSGYISPEQAQAVNCSQIAGFFATDLGKRLRTIKNVLREFKFSVLEDASRYYPGVVAEQILLQGVVDCALIEEDGIIVIDFKTDRVDADILPAKVEHYRSQVRAYADALERIYEKRVKENYLYFFSIGQFVKM